MIDELIMKETLIKLIRRKCFWNDKPRDRRSSGLSFQKHFLRMSFIKVSFIINEFINGLSILHHDRKISMNYVSETTLIHFGTIYEHFSPGFYRGGSGVNVLIYVPLLWIGRFWGSFNAKFRPLLQIGSFLRSFNAKFRPEQI